MRKMKSYISAALASYVIPSIVFQMRLASQGKDGVKYSDLIIGFPKRCLSLAADSTPIKTEMCGD